MANAKMDEIEPVMVLQRRHLYKQPLEYLVKYRASSSKCKEIWIPKTVLVAMEKGSSLIRQFKKTKAFQMGVDAYLGKRRRLMKHSEVTRAVELKSVSNHIPSMTEDSSSEVDKTKNILKSGKEPTGASVTNSSRASDADSKATLNSVGKAKLSSARFDAQLNKNSALSHNSFINHKTNLSKYQSSLKQNTPLLPRSLMQERSLSRPKQCKKRKEGDGNNLKSVQQEISTFTNNNGIKILKTAAGFYEDDVVSVSSESSSDEVLYSLAQEHDEQSGNGICSSAEFSDLKRKSKDPGNVSKKLRVSEMDTDSVKSDSEVNFKHSLSDSLNIKKESSLKQGSTSQLLNRCSFGGFSSHSLTDSLSNPDPRNRTSVGLVAEPHTKPPRKKKLHTNKDNDSDDNVQIERRISIRQTESAFRFKEIVVRKCSKYMHLVTLSQTPSKNVFNPKVFHELTVALRNAVNDDCHVVLLTASGNVFSSGIDIDYLLNSEEDRKLAAKNMAISLREFINCLIAFPKPIVVAVNGPAVGLGMAILPLCDIIYASDKACFSCPYTTLCQTPEGCASYTFPKMMGMAMANELLFRGRKITALEANQIGLITQVFWPDNLMSEVTPRVQHLAAQSLKVMKSTKALIRSCRRSKLEFVNAAECQLLVDCWTSAECQKAMKSYLEKTSDLP